MVALKRADGSVVPAGRGMPTRVNALIGASHRRDFRPQIDKLDALHSSGAPCQIISDLSIINIERPIWKAILERGYVAASLPIYTVEPKSGRIDGEELLYRVTEQIEGGVGIITIHPTPTREIAEMAQHRLVPWTSRGGSIIVGDLLRAGSGENVYLRILPQIVELARKHKAVISLGASFRSANIFDSFDAAQVAEIEFQLSLAAQISREGAQVIIESPGHARPADIALVSALLAPSGHPIMPLGPIPTDAAVGEDHISSAIGATLMGLAGAAHILAAVTREEHTGNIPSIASTIEAVKAAAIAAHIIDIEMIGDTKLDRAIVDRRARFSTCVDGKATKGCSRCANKCPLWH